MNIDAQLRAQNNAHGWLDCNAHGLPHRWEPSQAKGFWTCTRCPVDTYDPWAAPKRYLGSKS